MFDSKIFFKLHPIPSYEEWLQSMSKAELAKRLHRRIRGKAYECSLICKTWLDSFHHKIGTDYAFYDNVFFHKSFFTNEQWAEIERFANFSDRDWRQYTKYRDSSPSLEYGIVTTKRGKRACKFSWRSIREKFSFDEILREDFLTHLSILNLRNDSLKEEQERFSSLNGLDPEKAKLIIDLHNFDWYYDFIDDPHTWRTAHRKYEELAERCQTHGVSIKRISAKDTGNVIFLKELFA